jgi:hypothetical protein
MPGEGGLSGTIMFTYREEGRILPKVVWGDSRVALYYIGVEPKDTTVVEAGEIDFEELLLRLDAGDSIFMTLKQEAEGFRRKKEVNKEWL